MQRQHYTCHRAWKVYVNQHLDNGYEFGGLPVHVLLRELKTIARRDALKFSLKLEMNPNDVFMKNKMLEVSEPFFSYQEGRIHDAGPT